jgi:hypothetical protein
MVDLLRLSGHDLRLLKADYLLVLRWPWAGKYVRWVALNFGSKPAPGFRPTFRIFGWDTFSSSYPVSVRRLKLIMLGHSCRWRNHSHWWWLLSCGVSHLGWVMDHRSVNPSRSHPVTSTDSGVRHPHISWVHHISIFRFLLKWRAFHRCMELVFLLHQTKTWLRSRVSIEIHR